MKGRPKPYLKRKPYCRKFGGGKFMLHGDEAYRKPIRMTLKDALAAIGITLAVAAKGR